MSFKGLTSTVFNMIADSFFVFNTVMSRESFYQKSFMLEFGFKPWQVNHTLKRLEKSQHIKYKNGKLYLTQKGLTKVKYYKIEKIRSPSKSQWDKKWRLIVFDIPETIREARDTLRSKLREWGCYKVQQSVFVFPFSCEKEILAINKILETQFYVQVFLVNNLGVIEQKVKKHFNL